jgi:hypothetical protein
MFYKPLSHHSVERFPGVKIPQEADPPEIDESSKKMEQCKCQKNAEIMRLR